MKGRYRFSLREKSLYNRCVLGANAMKDTSRIRSLRNEADRASVQEFRTINLNSLKVSSPTKKRARMDRSTTLRKNNNENRKNVIGWQPFATTRLEKRRKTSCNGGCRKEDNKESKEDDKRHPTDPSSRIYCNNTFRF